MKAGEVELSEKAEATCCVCCVGEALGELLDMDERSDDALLMVTSCTGVLLVTVPRRVIATAAGGSTYIALGQQLGTELHVVLEVEGAARLELVAEAGHGDGLTELLHAAHATELPVGVLGDRQPRRPPVSPVVVVRGRGAGGCGLVVVVAELVVGRHVDGLEGWM